MSFAFVTGSYAYGVPRADSDIDLVVYLSGKDLDRLRTAHNQDAEHEEDYITAGGHPFKFGRLNLLCCTDKKLYDIWFKGTAQLKRRAPVTRNVAIAHMEQLRHEAGYANCGPPQLDF
jgi:predicted nucleotidyltransferase